MENQSLNEEIMKNNLSFSNKRGFFFEFFYFYMCMDSLWKEGFIKEPLKKNEDFDNVELKKKLKIPMILKIPRKKDQIEKNTTDNLSQSTLTCSENQQKKMNLIQIFLEVKEFFFFSPC